MALAWRALDPEPQRSLATHAARERWTADQIQHAYEVAGRLDASAM